MMKRIDIDNMFMSNVLNNDEYLDVYKKMMVEVAGSTAIYKGEPIPFLPMPKMYNEEDLKAFKELSTTMMGILRKVIDKYLVDEEYRKEFRFGKLLEDMILKDHGYNAYMPMARIDIFYRNKNEFKFCELNADGSSAMNEDREISRIFMENGVFDNLNKNFEAKNFELFDSWVQECKNMFKEYGGNLDEENTVAIVDWAGGGTVNEFEIFKDAFNKNGFKAFIVDPRELVFKDGKLFYKDIKIDIIYRRLVTREIIDRSGEIQDFIKGCLQGDVCVIGPIKSQIIHNKRIFKILHDERTKKILEESEVEFVKRHIPMTNYFEGDDWDFEELIKDKNNLILKPTDLYASRGVYTGRDFDDEVWREKLQECIDNDYLIQEYYVPHKTELLELKNDKIVKGDFNNITGIYMYNEKMQGLYSRVGKNPIISGLHDCYTLPSFVISEK